MPNMLVSLTDAICRRAAPEPGEYSLRDTRQPGLSLRVQTCGSRSWIMRYRVDRRQVRHRLGAFPEIGIRQARQMAAAVRAQGESVALLSANTPLFEVFQAEHEARCGPLYKSAGLRTYQLYVETQLLTAFAGQRLHLITRPDVLRWFEAYSIRSPGGANRALGILGHILGRAKAWGYVPSDWSNPVRGIRRNRRRVVGSFLSEAQLGQLGAVLDRRIADGCSGSALFRFLALTGCRLGEAIALEWRDVRGDQLRLRDSKTGPRDVPLGALVIRFLGTHRSALDRRARTGSSPVFPLVGGQHYEAARSVWTTIKRKAGLPSGFRIHDLRHNFASHAIMSGETLFSTSKLLGHSHVAMTARYAHLADDALSQAAEAIGMLLLRQAGPSLQECRPAS
jgi:integrase